VIVVQVLWLAAAGAVGAVARYGLAGLVQRRAGENFPAGTLAVNLAGCLVFGFVWGLLEDRLGAAAAVRLVVLTGFVGSFTTFSTFAFESAGLLQGGQIAAALANVVGQTVLGILLVWLGMAAGRAL
jgi:fluoride exporter